MRVGDAGMRDRKTKLNNRLSNASVYCMRQYSSCAPLRAASSYPIANDHRPYLAENVRFSAARELITPISAERLPMRAVAHECPKPSEDTMRRIFRL
jgi:hypothetical protein